METAAVKRKGFACVQCRKRKTKCTGEEPCVNCRKRKEVCTYPLARKRRGRVAKTAHTATDTLSVSHIITLDTDAKTCDSDSIPPTDEASPSKALTPESHTQTPEDKYTQLHPSIINNRAKIWNHGKDNRNGMPAALSATDMISTENQWTTPAFDLIGPDSTLSSMISKNFKHIKQSCKDMEPERLKSPWFSYSLDKYRFHRRYQSVLPYYFAGSLLSQLPQHLIAQNCLERPRIQNYGFNLAGGKFPQIPHSKSWDNTRFSFWQFTNTKHLIIIRKLLIYYFNEINPIFNIIHEKIFWKQFDSKFLTINHNEQNNDRSNALFKSMLYLIIITAIRFIDGGVKLETHNLKHYELELIRSDSKMENNLFNYSYHIVSTLSFEWESFELIQSWLLIAFYLRSSHRQTSCWNALSEAIRICKGMSLEINQFPLNHIQYEESKAWHCFWCCFIMDKFISFQIGRCHQLELPVVDMIRPDDQEGLNNLGFKTWFKTETIFMFELSLMIFEFQKCKDEEMPLNQSLQLRDQLNDWLIEYQNKTGKNINSTINELLNVEKLFVLQPIMSYIDVALTMELRSIFPKIDPPKEFAKATVFALPLDLGHISNICKLSLEIITKIVHEDSFFIPWWNNLSNLFTLTLLSLIMAYFGLQVDNHKLILSKVMSLWKELKSIQAINEPVMLQECLWCIKMLNHICCTTLTYSSQLMENIISFNHGDSIANKNKFEQFQRVDEISGQDKEKTSMVKENNNNNNNITMSDISTNSIRILRSGRYEGTESSIETQIEQPDEYLNLDLLSSLQWFDENFG